MEYNENSNIGEIVAHDYKTALIFKTNKIDFCCNGNRTIAEAASKKKLDASSIVNELNNIALTNIDHGIDFNSWPVDFLADYIERIHHAYVVEKLPIIMQFLDKIRKVHGENYPELYKIYHLFAESAIELTQHMKKEEAILFPYARAKAKKSNNENILIGNVESPVKVMMHEHENEGERFRKIRSLANDFIPPDGACSTYKVAFSMLEEFEADLHKHIHLENNILFPKLLNI